MQKALIVSDNLKEANFFHMVSMCCSSATHRMVVASFENRRRAEMQSFANVSSYRRENVVDEEKSVIAINHPVRQALNFAAKDFLTLVPGQSACRIPAATPSARPITVGCGTMIDDQRNYRLSPPRRSFLLLPSALLFPMYAFLLSPARRAISSLIIICAD